MGRGPYTAGGDGRDPPHRSGPRARLPSAPAAIGGSGGPFTPPPPGPSAPHPSAPGPSGPSAPGPSGGSRSRVRLVRYANGGIFGELDFFLHNQRSFDAEAASEETSVLRLRRERLRAMQAEAPQLAAALEHALLKYLCFQVSQNRLLQSGNSTTFFALCTRGERAMLLTVHWSVICAGGTEFSMYLNPC